MHRTSDFDYALPPELIAQTPSVERGASRLLVVERGGTAAPRHRDAEFREILELIPAGDLVVLNTTKVRHARLLGTRPTGTGEAEVLLLTPRADGTWEAMGKPGKSAISRRARSWQRTRTSGWLPWTRPSVTPA